MNKFPDNNELIEMLANLASYKDLAKPGDCQQSKYKLIIAGSYRQYMDYLRVNKLPIDGTRYITEAEQIYGYDLKKCEIVFTGTWRHIESTTHGKRLLKYLEYQGITLG